MSFVTSEYTFEKNFFKSVFHTRKQIGESLVAINILGLQFIVLVVASKNVQCLGVFYFKLGAKISRY